MARTISKSSKNGINLTDPGNDPVTVLSGVTIGGATKYALHGTAAKSWTITNSGSLIGTRVGVQLDAGGTVVNAAGGRIDVSMPGPTAGIYGVRVAGGGSVANNGYISAGAVYQRYNATGLRQGQVGVGVALTAGGTVTNGGSITTALIDGARLGVQITGGAGLVVNRGRITGGSGYTDNRFSDPNLVVNGGQGTGVSLGAGGTVTNGSDGAISATIYGLDAGVDIAGQAGVVINEGSIFGYTFYNSSGSGSYPLGVGVGLGAGGLVQNGLLNRHATIKGGLNGVVIFGQSGSVLNFGTIIGKGEAFAGIGVRLLEGGSVSNISNSALITGGYEGVVSGQYAAVSNQGTILGVSSFEGTRYGSGVDISGGGRVTNGDLSNPAALIEGGTYGVQIRGGTGAVVNSGTIRATGTRSVGVDLAGGSVSNFGLISSMADGVRISGLGRLTNDGTISGKVGVQVEYSYGSVLSTVTNRGTIIGTGGTAVAFSGSVGAVLQLAPNCVLQGDAVADTTISASNTLQLLSDPSTAGNFGGLGTDIVGFGTVSLDAKAVWLLRGTNNGGDTLGVRLGAQSELFVGGLLEVGRTLRLSGTGLLSLINAPGFPGQLAVGGSGLGTDGLATVGAAVGGTPAGTIVGTGTIAASITDNGLVRASGGKLAAGGAVGGSGTVAITPGAVFNAGGTLSGVSVVFLDGKGIPSPSVLELAKPAAVTSVLSGFGSGDRIDLLGAVATGISFSTSTRVLSVTGSRGVTLAALHFSAAYNPFSFHFASDGHGGTNIGVG